MDIHVLAWSLLRNWAISLISPAELEARADLSRLISSGCGAGRIPLSGAQARWRGRGDPGHNAPET